MKMLKAMPGSEIDSLLGAVVETTSQGICLVNSETKIAYANYAFCKMIGRACNEILGLKITNFMSPVSVQHFMNRQAERLAGRLRQQYEVQYIHGITGEKIVTLANVSPLLDDRGQFLYSIGIHTNINETKRIQEELDKTVQRLKKAQQMARIGFWEYDIQSEEIWWSDEVYTIFQSPKPESYESYLKLLHPDDLNRSRDLKQFAEHVGTSYRTQMRIVRPTGEVRHLLNFVEIEKNLQGNPQKFVGTIHDITDEVHRETMLEEQRAQMLASSKLSTLGEMAGGIAHEINTPLAVVLLNAESLVRELKQLVPEDHGAHKRAHKIIEVTQKIAKIVNGLKTFSRNVDHDPCLPTSLKSIVEETLQLCQEKFRNSGVSVICEPFDPDLTIECRATQVSQVLLNLFNNAFDAILNEDKKWIQIDVQASEEFVDLAVTDSGPGVDPALRSKIFNPFFTTKEVGKGMGLGLSTSKGLIEAHDGKMWLDSESPRTRFVFRLPRRYRPNRQLEV